VDDHPRFSEAANADVIVRFPNWDVINIVKPDTTENGYFTLHHRLDTEQILARSGIQHNLAVVVCGCLSDLGKEEEQQRIWISILKDLHFKRAVFLRASWSQKIDGLSVIRDVELGTGALAKQG